MTGDGFVAAGFRHRTSRAADPQLHTHVAIANLVHSAGDGRWTALDARPLYQWSRPVGFLYEAQLRWELTRRLGVAWGPVHNGIADVAHIPSGAIEAFSTRRRRSSSTSPSTARAVGGPPRSPPTPPGRPRTPTPWPEYLVDGWRAKAKVHGLDDHVLAAALHRQELAGPPAPRSPSADRPVRPSRRSGRAHVSPLDLRPGPRSSRPSATDFQAAAGSPTSSPSPTPSSPRHTSSRSARPPRRPPPPTGPRPN